MSAFASPFDPNSVIDSPMLDLALSMAERFHVHPTNPINKEPLTNHGFIDATQDLDQIAAWWRWWPNAMPAIATGVSGLCVLDIDVKNEKDGLATLEALGHSVEDFIGQTPVTRTQSGGYHIYFRADPALRLGSGTSAAGPGLDIIDATGYVIAPGAVMGSGARYEPITEFDEVEILPAPGWVYEAVAAKRKRKGPPPASAVNTGGGTNVGELTSNILNQINLHDSIRDLAAHHVKAGMGGGAVTNMLRSLMQASTGPRDKRWQERYDDIPRAVSSAETKFGRPEPFEGPALHIPRAQVEARNQPGENGAALQARPFDGEIPAPREWAFGRFLMTGQVSVLAGPPGVSKSTFAIQTSVAFATHRPFAGMDPASTGPAWVFNNEDDCAELNRRVLAACKIAEIDPRDLNGRLYLNSGADTPLLVAREDRASRTIVREPHVDALVAEIQRLGVKLLVIDPFAETFEANENDNGHMKRVAALYREVAQRGGCAVLLVHHTPKSADGDHSAGDQSAVRGASSITGVARIVTTLFPMTKKDAEDLSIPLCERHLYVRLDDAKANFSLISDRATWLRKKGQNIGNGSGLTPSDVVGVLDHDTDLSDRRGVEAKKAEAKASEIAQVRDRQLDAIQGEVVRVLRLNGGAMSLNAVCNAVDHDMIGLHKNAVRGRIEGCLGAGGDHGFTLRRGGSGPKAPVIVELSSFPDAGVERPER